MSILVLLAGLTVAADPPVPPGVAVVRPGGSGVIPASTATIFPDKAGFWVVRPQQPGAAIPTAAKLVGDKQGPAVVAKPQPAAKADGAAVHETWDAAYIDGNQVGYFYTGVRKFTKDGQEFLYGVKEMRLTIARFDQRVSIWAEDATTEKPDGAVLTTRMRMGIGKDQKLSLTGKVTGNSLAVTIEGETSGTETVGWPDGVLGIAKEATLLRDKKPKPGDVLDYLHYEGRLNRVVKLTLTVVGVEETTVPGSAKPRKLLKVEQAMVPVKLPNGEDFKLPPATVWADPTTFEEVKMESSMPELGGTMVVVRTTRDVATRPPGKVPDLAEVQSIPLDRIIPNVHGTGAVTYKVTLTAGTLAADKAFPSDGRQTVAGVDATARSFDLTVTSGPTAPTPAPGPEFLGASFFIDWNDPQVKRYAATATAGLPPTATPLDKARAVESWVTQNMRATEFSQAMATCANVARTLSGDCTEYAMLAAGMCRAVGVPARTALGLVYAPGRGGKPFLAYHMWFEVYADGRWVGLDATLGNGGIGPGHLKITDASWDKEKSFTPLLPVLGVLGARPKVEVSQVRGR